MGALQAGDVVRMDTIDNTANDVTHRYIILGISEHICFVVGSTSQIKNKQNHAQKINPNLENGYLYLKPSEYQSHKVPKACSLTKETIFDVNQVKIYIEDTITIQCDKISDTVKVKLINCIKQSPILSAEEKECYINNLN